MMETQMSERISKVLQVSALNICQQVVDYKNELRVKAVLSVDVDGQEFCSVSFDESTTVGKSSITIDSISAISQVDENANSKISKDEGVACRGGDAELVNSRPEKTTAPLTPTNLHSQVGETEVLTGSMKKLYNNVFAQAMRIWYDEEKREGSPIKKLIPSLSIRFSEGVIKSQTNVPCVDSGVTDRPSPSFPTIQMPPKKRSRTSEEFPPSKFARTDFSPAQESSKERIPCRHIVNNRQGAFLTELKNKKEIVSSPLLSPNSLKCYICSQLFHSQSSVNHHIRTVHLKPKIRAKASKVTSTPAQLFSDLATCEEMSPPLQSVAPSIVKKEDDLSRLLPPKMKWLKQQALATTKGDAVDLSIPRGDDLHSIIDAVVTSTLDHKSSLVKENKGTSDLARLANMTHSLPSGNDENCPLNLSTQAKPPTQRNIMAPLPHHMNTDMKSPNLTQPLKSSMSTIPLEKPLLLAESDPNFPTLSDGQRFLCGLCGASFTFQTNLTRHQRKIHGKPYVRKPSTATSQPTSSSSSSTSSSSIRSSSGSFQSTSSQGATKSSLPLHPGPPGYPMPPTSMHLPTASLAALLSSTMPLTMPPYPMSHMPSLAPRLPSMQAPSSMPRHSPIPK